MFPLLDISIICTGESVSWTRPQQSLKQKKNAIDRKASSVQSLGIRGIFKFVIWISILGKFMP